MAFACRNGIPPQTTLNFLQYHIQKTREILFLGRRRRSIHIDPPHCHHAMELLLELPHPLVASILEFLVEEDRFSVAATCRHLLEKVESFSKREIERIATCHRVDETWHYRLGMQAGLDAAARSEYGVVPSTLSHRHLLHSASRTHLYSFADEAESGLYTALACSPCGNFLLSGHEGMVRMWDLTTNTCVRTFVEGHEFFVTSLLFVADHVVSLALEDETLRIWTLTGTCKHLIRIGFVLHQIIHTAGQEVLFNDIDDAVFYTLDVLSGEVRALHDESALCHLSDLSVYGLLVSGNWVLAIMQNREDVEESRPLRGIYVFHRSSFAQESFLRGDFVAINICDNCDVVLATQDGRIDVM
jgi:hypothetical protein